MGQQPLIRYEATLLHGPISRRNDSKASARTATVPEMADSRRADSAPMLVAPNAISKEQAHCPAPAEPRGTGPSLAPRAGSNHAQFAPGGVPALSPRSSHAPPGEGRPDPEATRCSPTLFTPAGIGESRPGLPPRFLLTSIVHFWSQSDPITDSSDCPPTKFDVRDATEAGCQATTLQQVTSSFSPWNSPRHDPCATHASPVAQRCRMPPPTED